MSGSRYLADTHILLWALSDDDRLSKRHREILLSDAEIFFSAASIWEIAIKRSIGKLKAPAGLVDLLQQAGFSALDIKAHHAEAVGELPFLHGDPFDRLLVAQAGLEKLILMSADALLGRYDVEIV